MSERKRAASWGKFDTKPFIVEMKMSERSDTPRTDAALDMVANEKPFKPVSTAFLELCLTLERDLAECRRDAERYRWLRQQHWDTSILAVVANPKLAVKLGHDCPALVRLDYEIDAALAKESDNG